MSKSRDKVVESLPENLLYNSDSGKICANYILCSNTSWGPFDVEKLQVDLNSSNSIIWSNIVCVEWVDFLVENSLPKLTFNAQNEDCNVKIFFSRKEQQVLVSTTKDLEFNSEFKCNLIIIDQFPNKTQSTSDPPIDSDQNSEKMTKTCKYCGINFSHQCTLEAHMTYYCSRRQNTMTELNNNPKFQRTWRTRQRNKQSIMSKMNNDDGSFSSKIFCDEDHKLKNIERKIQSKHNVNATFNNSDTTHLDSQLNLNSNPIILNSSSVNKKSILQPTLISNGSSSNSANLNAKSQNESNEKSRNHMSNNSDSEPENGNSNNLFFCAPCRLFFSSKDLYNIHLQLDSTSLQLSAVKCNSLVLAAPLINNNGIHYVPIHPRTTVLNPLNNNSIKMSQNYKSNNLEDLSTVAPLDLSMNNSSKSPITLSNDRIQIDVASRINAAAAAVNLGLPSCNPMIRSNKRPFLCPHCQTRFQLYGTFQAHQEFYCQGKRLQTDISVPDKRCRTASNNSGQMEFDSNVQKNDGSWNICNQGFKCIFCGFIGQTKRGIRIHCKNQCFKNKIQNDKSDNKSEDIDVCSPNAEFNNVSANVRSLESTDLCPEDSPVKIEPV